MFSPKTCFQIFDFKNVVALKSESEPLKVIDSDIMRFPISVLE